MPYSIGSPSGGRSGYERAGSWGAATPEAEGTRMRIRISVAAALITLAAAAPSVAAAPAPPVNDEPGGAIAVTSIPFTTSQSTTRATANDADGGCGAGAEDQATVWYTITLASDTRVLVDTAGSSYFTGVNVYTAGPGSEILTCVGGAAVFDAAAGQTYYVMIADIDGGRDGGRLEVSVTTGPPALEIGVAIESASLDSATGTVTVTGTATCNVTTDFFDVNLDVSQTQGRFTTRGFGGTSIGCSAGDTVAWSADVVGENGTFGAGSTEIDANAFACEFFTCDDAFATQTVRFRR
jgi:hypothetical protein